MISLAYTAVYALRNIEMLLCFAGVVGCVHSMDATAPDFQKMIDVKLTGSFLYVQAAACFMMPNEGARILFVSSISGQATNFPQPQAAYNVWQAGVLHMTRNLAAKWAEVLLFWLHKQQRVERDFTPNCTYERIHIPRRLVRYTFHGH